MTQSLNRRPNFYLTNRIEIIVQKAFKDSADIILNLSLIDAVLEP